MLSWPAAAFLAANGRRALAVILIAVVAMGAAFSQSAAALLASLVALAVFVPAWFWPAVTLRIGLWMTGATMLATPWLFSRVLAWGEGLHGVIPRSFFHRLEIWDHAASRALENFWLGHGIGAYRFLRLDPEQAARYKILTTVEPHPHNAAIQIWVETGLLGVAMALVFLVFVARSIDRMQPSHRACAIACLAAVMVTALLSYGLWQQTWMSIMGLAALGFVITGDETHTEDR
jgi:O-antigen ligase